MRRAQRSPDGAKRNPGQGLCGCKMVPGFRFAPSGLRLRRTRIIHRMTATQSKADLRTAALAKRDALSDEQRAAAAQAMAKRGLPFTIEPGMVVSGYSPIRSEIDPAPLMRKLAEHGAKLALPAVMARGKS